MNTLLRVALPLCLCLLTACPATEGGLQSGTYENQKQLVPDDYLYEQNIRTVQLYRGDFELNPPVINLNDPTPLTLEFDELLPPDARPTDFFVDFVNCDANWKPTNLLPIEFFEGFSQDRIDLFRRSEFTKVSYVHYRYQFPKPERFFKISGNYLIKVYRNGDPKDLVLTRRFIVADRRIPIQPINVLDERLQRQRLQELAFNVNTQRLNLINPAQELKVMVLQNFRWDNAVQMERPRFIARENLEYYLNLSEAFGGGTEFRWHDVRSTRFFSESMREVIEDEQYYSVYLFQDQARLRNRFDQRRDLNGDFFIEVQEWPNAPDISADYVMNFFRLKSSMQPGGDVYVFGAFTDWQTRPEYRMTYVAEQGRYETNVLLKQGVYDYKYVIKEGDGSLNEFKYEGMADEVENYYDILIYFRAPTDRTDRIIGFQPINY